MTVICMLTVSNGGVTNNQKNFHIFDGCLPNIISMSLLSLLTPEKNKYSSDEIKRYKAIFLINSVADEKKRQHR